MKNKSIVVIFNQPFRYGWQGSTTRIFHLRRVFNELGYKLVIIAGPAVDPDLQCKFDEIAADYVIRIGSRECYPGIIEGYPILMRVWRNKERLLGKNYYFKKKNELWAASFDIGFLCEKLLSDGIEPVCVWSICTGMLDSSLVAERMKNYYQIPWIFELQDPPARMSIDRKKSRYTMQYIECLERCDKVVVTSRSYGEFLKINLNVNNKKIKTLYLSWNASKESEIEINNEKFQITYAGVLDRKRSIIPLLEALTDLRVNFRSLLELLKITLIGSGPGFDDARKYVNKFSMSKYVEICDPMPKEVVLQITVMSDLMIAVQPRDYAMQIPGKIFELMSLGKAVLGIMPPDIESAEILKKSGLGFIHAEEDIIGIRDTLVKLIESWVDQKDGIHKNNDFINEFSLENLNLKIGELFRELGVSLHV